MGFGTLFIGSFFLLNISYYGYTDIIAAMIMMLGLYKLSYLNGELKGALYTCFGFAALSLSELIAAAMGLFGASAALDPIMPYVSSLRYVLIFAMSYLILTGIFKLAVEVDDRILAERAKRMSIFSFLYLILALFELPLIAGLLGNIAGYVFFALILLHLILTVFLLTTEYKAYAGICMPEDNVPKPERQSKFGFVNRFREHEEKKVREYAEYRRAKREKKKAKKK